MYTYDDGSRYIGDFDENGIKNGKGHIEASNGATYEGQFQKGTIGPKPFYIDQFFLYSTYIRFSVQASCHLCRKFK